jgi:hypothetical protein
MENIIHSVGRMQRLYMYKRNPVRTSQETLRRATKTKRSELFGETVAVYCENSMKHTNTLCGQNPEFQYVKRGWYV